MLKTAVVLALLAAIPTHADEPVKAQEAPKQAREPKGSGPSFAESMEWLQQKVHEHGRVLGTYTAGTSTARTWITYRLNPEGVERCKLTVEMQYLDADHNDATSFSASFSLKNVLVDDVAVKQEEDPNFRLLPGRSGKPASCIGIPTKPYAVQATLSYLPGKPYEYDSVELCFDTSDLGERVVRALKHMARICGASRKAKGPSSPAPGSPGG
jgi:hypothetical protein